MALNRLHRTPLGAFYRSPLGVFGPPPGSPAFIVGGAFTNMDSIAAADRVAKWNGTAWEAMSTGFTTACDALCWHNGELYAADFAAVYRWTGSAWSQLGPTWEVASPGILGLISFNGSLFVCGNLIRSNGVLIRGVSRWNGTDWVATGFSANASALAVHNLCEYNGALYAVGLFDVATNVTAGDGIQVWDGASTWSRVGSVGQNFKPAYNAAVFNGELVICGEFTAGASGVTNGNGIARWNGSAWSALGSGLGAGIGWALTVWDNQLIAGGTFTNPGGISANRVAAWSGSAWSALGSGLDNVVFDLLPRSDGVLVAVGGFTETVAEWDGSAWAWGHAGGNNVIKAIVGAEAP